MVTRKKMWRIKLIPLTKCPDDAFWYGLSFGCIYSLHSPGMTHTMQLSRPTICHLWIENMEAAESQKTGSITLRRKKKERKNKATG